MSLAIEIVEKLKADSFVNALLGQRVFLQRIPQSFSLPAIRVQRVSGPREYTMDGQYMAEGRLQITCYGESYAECSDAAAAVRLCLGGYRGELGPLTALGIFIEDERDLLEAPIHGNDVSLQGIQFDIIVKYQE